MHAPDPFQHEAIACRDRGIRIVAPAGSGKAETIARRVARRIDEGMHPKRILVLTFDKNAQKSLAGHVSQFVSAKTSPQVKSLNAFGLQVLKELFPQEIAPNYVTQNSQVFSELRAQFEPEEAKLPVLSWDGVRRTLTDLGNGAFAGLKNQGFRPGSLSDVDAQTKWLRTEYLRLPNTDESRGLDELWGPPSGAAQTDSYAGQIERILELYAYYDSVVRSRGVMDLTDQKSRAFHAVWSDQSKREALRRKFDEIIVDECQDINRLDALLIYAALGKETTLVLAGDDDQTIYEFRNAHSIYLREPERFFSDRTFTTVLLNINYRSPEGILSPAVRLIDHNAERIPKSPTSGVIAPGKVSVLPATSASQHARNISELVQQEARERGRYSDIAILCHSYAVMREMKEHLQTHGIPVNDENGKSDGVEVITFLKAKGREWPVVILPRSEDGVMPPSIDVREGNIEAVRRRYYVAMTRAAEHLVISYVRAGEIDVIHRTAEDEVVATNGASRFLFEAGLVTMPEQVTSAGNEAEDDDHAVAPEPETPVAIQVNPEQPARPAPDPEPATTPVPPPPISPGPRPNSKIQPWHLRKKEVAALERARSRWEIKDYGYAIYTGWPPLEALLKRVMKVPRDDHQTSIKDVIDRAFNRDVIDFRWHGRLHDWRILRNMIAHEIEDEAHWTPERIKTGHQMIERAAEFVAYLEDQVAPKQVVMETHDDFVQRLSGLVEMLRFGKPYAKTGRPLKAIRFNPERERLEILAMQFAMVLQDVRFYVPEEFRWTSSPLLSSFMVSSLGWVPPGVRGSNRNHCATTNEEEKRVLFGRLEALLCRECGEDDTRAFLAQRVADAVQLQNGNFHAGIKINPRVAA